jgi:hypothetical protein
MAALTTAYKQTFTIRDHKAFTAKMVFYISPSYTAAQIGNAAEALDQDIYAMQTGNSVLDPSGAIALVKAHGPFTTQAQPWTNAFNSTGDYKAVEDKAVFVFQDQAGVVHRYQLPCPLASIFMADQQTIDVSQAVVKQFLADMLFQTIGGTAPGANTLHPIVSASNYPLMSFVGGYRLMRKMQRKFNIFTLNPALNGPGE